VSSKLDLQSAYRRWFGVMQSGMRPDEAVQQAIGGQFEPFALIQVQMLRHFGLRDTDFLVDIGCGSGRTAIPLSRGHAGPYLGTDLVEELVAHARASCARPSSSHR